jgi:hypothetical protein
MISNKELISDAELQAIAELDLEPIKVKLMHAESGEGWSLEKANSVELDYRRFLTLMKMYPNEAAAPLMDVDIFWHYHILDTMKYAADCDTVFGYFKHHFPYIGLRGADDEQAHHQMGARMQELYEATFGEAYVREREPSRRAAATGATAFSAAPAVSAQAAFSAAPAVQAQTAFSAAPAVQARTAFSAAPAGPAQVAFSAAPAVQAQVAFSAAPAVRAQVAFSAAPAVQAQVAFSAAPAVQAQAAFSAAPAVQTQVAFSAAPAVKIAFSAVANDSAAVQSSRLYSERPRLSAT